MATALTERHLLVQDTIGARAAQQLAVAWRMLDLYDLDGSFRRWLVAALPVITENRNLSTAAAVDYLRRQRIDALGDPGVIEAAPEPPVEQVVTSARVTTVVAVKRAVAIGTPLEVAAQHALRRSTGDLSKLVLGGGRDTIIGSALAEPRVLGWRRVLRGASCSFCVLLAGRGAVYSSSTVTFRSHGHCDCGAEEVYRD